MGADLTSWRYQVPAFNGKVRLILIDLPGHGKSDKPKIDYTMDVFAKAVDAVLIDAGVKTRAGHRLSNDGGRRPLPHDGEAQGVQCADEAWMHGQEVARPERMAALLVPGLPALS